MVSRILAGTAVLAVAGAMAGCTSAGTSSAAGQTSSASGQKAAPLNLGVYCDTTCQAALKLKANPDAVKCNVAVITTTTSNPYGAAVLRTGQQAQKYFLNMNVKVFNGNNDPVTESSELNTVVTSGTKIVVLDPVVADALAPAVRAADAQGVKIIDIDRTVQAPVTTVIKAPDVPLAARAADHIAAVLHGKGTVAVLSGTPGASATIDRTNGFYTEMKKYPGIKIVANVNGNYNTDTAYNVVSNLLTRYPEGHLDWIFSMADTMSLGAIKALQAAHRTDVMLSGVDGQNQGIAAVQQGTYESTVAYPLPMPAGLAGAAKACMGESMPKLIPLSYPLITKANAAKYIGTNFG
jgi:ribose transport system substrate-binding protein